MNLFCLVPVKAPHLGKSRLAAVLSDAERRALNGRLAVQAIDCCADYCGAARTLVITSSFEVARLAAQKGVPALGEGDPPELNAGLSRAAARAIEAGAEGILVVPTDLPLLTAERLAGAAAALPEAPGCVLVPDLRGQGTNLLALAPARTDLFRFGPDSLRLHASTARAAGYRVHMHECEALGLDLDLPEDLEAWAVSAR